MGVGGLSVEGGGHLSRDVPNDLLTQPRSPGRTPGRPKLVTGALTQTHRATLVTNYHSGRRLAASWPKVLTKRRMKATPTACLRRRDPGKYPRRLAPGRDEATGPGGGAAIQRERSQQDPRCALPHRPAQARGTVCCRTGPVGTQGPLGLMAVVWGEHTTHTRGREQCRRFTRRGGPGGRPGQVGSTQGTGLPLCWGSGIATYTGTSQATRKTTRQDRRGSTHSHISTREANGS